MFGLFPPKKNPQKNKPDKFVQIIMSSDMRPV